MKMFSSSVQILSPKLLTGAVHNCSKCVLMKPKSIFHRATHCSRETFSFSGGGAGIFDFRIGVFRVAHFVTVRVFAGGAVVPQVALFGLKFKSKNIIS